MKRENLYLLICILLFSVLFYISRIRPSENSHTITLVKNQSQTKLPKKDRIDLAMRHEFDKTHDPSLGYIPKDRLKTAREFMKSKAAKKNKSQAKAMTLSWTERGPDNVGGRTRAIMWDPNDASNTKVWAGAISGGLWYNTDITSASTQWQAVNDEMENLSISAIAYDPNTTTTMYIGTGEGHQIGTVRGDGVFKSTDSGTTWTQLTSANGFYATDDKFHYVNDLVVLDESGTSVLYVGTQTSVNDYENSEYSTSGENGLWRSNDGGVNFTQVLPTVSGQSYAYGVADIEVTSSGRMFVGTAVSYGGGVILYSDDGTTWATAYDPGSGDRVEIAISPSDPDIVYAMAADGSSVGWMVKTTVGDQASPTTWSSLSVPAYKSQGTCVNDASNDFTRGQAWYDLIMAVHPSDASIVVIGGIDLYKSTDGGSSFGLVSYWTGGCDTEVHADQHVIAFNPNSVNQAIFGNDGGMYYSSDIGSASNPTISARNNGYNVTQFYGTAIHPTSGTDYYLAGAQDNGSQQFSSAGVNSTTEVSGGDGAFCNIDQDEPSYQWTQYVYNTYYRSTDGGSNFSSQINLGSGTGRFINPSRYDNTQNLMYMAAASDTYLRWDNPQTGSTTSTVAVSEFNGEQVSAVTVSPNTSNRVFFGTGSSGVFIIDNAHTGTSKSGTSDVTDISSSSFPDDAYVSNIDVETGDDNHILVVFSNYGVNSIWETTDGGTNWTSVEGDLPDMPIRWAIFHPQDEQRVFLATDLGVWSTDNLNGGQTYWEPSTGDGIPNVRTDMLLYRTSDYEMVAATHGRGLFTADITLPTTSAAEVSFGDAGIYFTEATTVTSGCRAYTDITVTMEIANAPTGQADVAVAVNTSSASNPSDYEFIGSQTASFPNGDASNRSVTIRVYDDTEIESLETIELNYSISGTTNAVKSSENTTYTLKINDNDSAPVDNTTEFEIWSESFDSPTGWTEIESTKSGGSKSNWLIGQGCGQTISGSTRLVGQITGGGSAACDYVKDGSAAGIIIYKTVDATNYHDVRVAFDWMAEGETSQDYGSLLYSTDGGSNWTVVGSELSSTGYTVNSASEVLPASLNGTSFILGWRWLDDNDNTQVQPALAIDNIVVYGQTDGDGVASTLTQTDSQYLGPYDDVYFTDASGEILAKIENTSSHDYGCTTVTLDRSGTATAEFWSATTSEYMMDKTVFVTPTTNNTSGTYTITLYYSNTEVANWMAATSKTTTDLKLAKTSLAVSSITSSSSGDYNAELGSSNSAVAFGTDYAITSSFTTGFSGIGAGDPGPVPAALPIEIINLKAELINKNDALISWTSMTEDNTDYILIEHSTTGNQFERVGKIEAAGNSYAPIAYQFNHENINYGIHYYRLKTVDLDGQFDQSTVVSVFQDKSSFDLKAIYPMPANDVVNLDYLSDNTEDVTLSIIDSKGQLVSHSKLSGQLGANSSEISCSDLRNGIYVLVLENKGRSVKKRLVVSK